MHSHQELPDDTLLSYNNIACQTEESLAVLLKAPVMLRWMSAIELDDEDIPLFMALCGRRSLERPDLL